MSKNYILNIRAAAKYSRKHNVVATLVGDDWTAAKKDFRDGLEDGEKYNAIENGKILELRAYRPGTVSPTVRIEVIHAETQPTCDWGQS